MKMFKLFVLLALASGLVFPGAALAQAEIGYPSRPVRFIVPIGPGSAGDSVTRYVAEQFRTASGQPTFVENRPGADLVVGTQNLLASPADGHSVLLVSNSTLVINPFFVKDLPYKVEELTPLVNLLRSPVVLVTAPGSRFKTLADLLDAARKAPDSVTIGIYGNTYRLAALDLAHRSGVRFNLIPYKGASQAVTDVIGGSADAALLDVGGATPLVAGNKVRALAIAAERRHAAIPAVPTFIESGIADYTAAAFIGLAVHAKTPAPIAAKLEALLLQTLVRPEVREQIVRLSGAEFAGTGRQPFAAMIAAETERTRELIRISGIEPQR